MGLFRPIALVMYIFTAEKEIQDLFINSSQSGSMCINDTIMQYASKDTYPVIAIGN